MPDKYTDDQIADTVCDTIASFGPDRSAVVRDAKLEGLEIDSLDMVELAQVIEQDLGIRVETADFKGVETVGESIDVIVSKSKASAPA
jgi:acyl carrier protein